MCLVEEIFGSAVLVLNCIIRGWDIQGSLAW